MIERCLRSVAFADALVVVDSGSTDDTVKVAEACGARVVTTVDWPGFGAQKNRALALAESDWVLSLDADEWLETEAASEVRAAIARGDADAYELPRRSRFCGQVVRHCGWSPDYVCRLFRRGRARFSDDLVHERLIVDGRVARLKRPIDHDSIESWAEAEDKIRRYSQAAAQQMAARGRRGSRLRAALHNRLHGKPGKEGESLAQLRGWVAFLHMTDPERAKPFLVQLKQLEERGTDE